MRVIIIFVLAVSPLAGFGQSFKTQTKAQGRQLSSDRNNVFKLVLTPRILYPNSYVFSYERVLRPNQTASITAGSLQFPVLFSGGKTFVVDQNKASGFTVGFDYRFYLSQENKYDAPRGVYIGPYISYYGFSNDRMIRDASSTTSNAFSTNIGFTNIGAQIGYQFVVNDRWTFDFIFIGPCITNYHFKMNLDGNFTADEDSEIVQEVLDKFPLLKEVVNEGSVTVHGTNSKWAPGYRFTAMVGYKFGVRKK